MGMRDAYKKLLFVIGNSPMGKRIRIGEKIYYFIYIFLEKLKYEV